jgi:hypothetical protein
MVEVANAAVLQQTGYTESDAERSPERLIGRQS